MAAVSQQGSRAGLITTLIIFIVLFLVSTVLFFTTNADLRVHQKRLADNTKKYDSVIKSNEMTDADYQALQELQKAPENRGRSMYDIMKAQRAELSKVITGEPVPASKAIQDARDAAARANETLKPAVVVPGEPLTAGMSTLTQAIVQLRLQLQEREADLKAAQQKYADGVANYKKELDVHRAAVATAEGKVTKTTEETVTYRTSKDEQFATLEKALATTIETNRKQMEDLNTQLTTRQQEIDKLKEEVAKAHAKLNAFRMAGTSEPSIRRADGAISSITGSNGRQVVYIDKGLGRQISPGMTFEVYDKNEGVPRLQNENEEQLPVGKASIEIVRVSPQSSEAKVIRQAPGTQLFVGDIIANLIYDPNVKWRFKVYGNFDIDQNGVPTPQETEVVKRLIVQWGGIVTEDLNVDTDFVVMGKEPIVPTVTKEQLEGDPIREFEHKKAEEARVAYEEVKNKALELHVPVLNQNRFLYFIGFFDQARK